MTDIKFEKIFSKTSIYFKTYKTKTKLVHHRSYAIFMLGNENKNFWKFCTKLCKLENFGTITCSREADGYMLRSTKVNIQYLVNVHTFMYAHRDMVCVPFALLNFKWNMTGYIWLVLIHQCHTMDLYISHVYFYNTFLQAEISSLWAFYHSEMHFVQIKATQPHLAFEKKKKKIIYQNKH